MELKFTPEAQADREWWKQNGDDATKRKIKQLLNEMEQHPRTGTGKPELLSGDLKGVWSRRINGRCYDIKKRVSVFTLTLFQNVVGRTGLEPVTSAV